MKSELNTEGLPKQITIEPTPSHLQLQDLQFEPVDFERAKSGPQGKCLTNAYNVSKRIPDAEIIEGAIVYINQKNKWKIFFHAWNRLGDLHFDQTREKVWNNLDDFKNAKELRYAPVKSYFASELNGIKEISFSEETMIIVREMIQVVEERNKKQ